MAMILVITIILITISLLRWSLDLLRPLDAWIILDVQKYLLHGLVQGGIILELALGEVDLRPDPATIIAFSRLTTPFFLLGLLMLPFSLV